MQFIDDSIIAYFLGPPSISAADAYFRLGNDLNCGALNSTLFLTSPHEVGCFVCPGFLTRVWSSGMTSLASGCSHSPVT